MRYDLAALIRRQRNPRRRDIVIREIRPPATLATDLYRRVYARVVALLENAAPRIIAEYERSLPIRDAIADSAEDVDGLFTLLGSELTRLVLDLEAELADWALRVEKWHRGAWRGAVLSASGVDLETILNASGRPTTVAETVAWNTSLIRDVGEQARSRIANSVFSGLKARKPAREVETEIRQAVAMSRRRSQLIASDQLTKLASSLDSERMYDAGIRRFKYRHSGKLHPRDWHRARDGKIYELETGKPVDGGAPIPPDDMPGMPPWCGCKKQAIVELD